MTTRISTLPLVLCATLLSASVWANVTNPGAGASMPPAPPVTLNLGATPEMGASQNGNGPIAVIQAFPREQALPIDGAAKFWLGMLGLLGATLFATGTTLIAQSMKTPVATETAKASKARLVPVDVRATAAV